MSDICPCGQEHVTDPWSGKPVTQTRIITPEPEDDVVIRPNFLHVRHCWACSHMIARHVMCVEITPAADRLAGHRGVSDKHLRPYHPECVRL